MVLKYYSKTVDKKIENIQKIFLEIFIFRKYENIYFSCMKNPNYNDFQNNALENKYFNA